jgi:ssDNA-binding Zn-finger/Zn-ribbon topoisomerase 1
MIWIIAAIVIVAIGLFFLARRSEKRKPAEKVLPYQKSEALFSPAERSFLGVLHKAVGNNAAIFGKVRVADVVEPKTGLGRSARQKAFNKISAKHFDFLLCNKEDLSVICAIELNDGSHNSKRRQERDEFLKEACEAAGVPLVQVPARSGYVIDEVKQLLSPYLGIEESPFKETLKPPAPKKSNGNGKVCPNCSASMVKRIAKKGSYAGMEFWACSAYPKCKTIEAISV